MTNLCRGTEAVKCDRRVGGRSEWRPRRRPLLPLTLNKHCWLIAKLFTWSHTKWTQSLIPHLFPSISNPDWRRENRVPRLESFPIEVGRRHSRWYRQRLHATRFQGPLSGRCFRNHSFPRLGHCRTRRSRLCRRVLLPIWPWSDQRRQEANEYYSYHRRRSSSAQVSHAGRHGRHRVRWRCAARSGPYRRPQLAIFPQERRTLCHFHQGVVHRFDRSARSRIRCRG